MANKLNKGVLVDLLKDPEVKAAIEALIVELLGKDKGALLLALLEQLQVGQGEDAPTVKPKWYVRVFNWAKAILPFVLSFFKKK